MGALPKKKMAKARSRKRKGQLRVQKPALITCSHCRKPTLSHTVCRNCGYYGDKEVLLLKKVKKVTKA